MLAPLNPHIIYTGRSSMEIAVQMEAGAVGATV